MSVESIYVTFVQRNIFFAGFTDSFDNSFHKTTSNIGLVGFAFYNGLWAYDGW